MPRLAKWVFLSLLAIYLPLTRGHFWSTDEVGMYQQTRSLWEAGNLAVAPGLVNSVPGRGGRYFVPWGAGQAVLALPLYGIGRGMGHLLDGPRTTRWKATFAGPVVGDLPDRRWGGDVEIFFTNLFNCFVVAGLGAVFFQFSLALGAAPRWALVATLLMALTSHVAGFSATFFQHPAEALFLLWTFYLLFQDRRWLAGTTAAVLAMVRVQAAMHLPILAAYLLWRLWKRGLRQPVELVRQMAPFVVPATAGILVSCAVNYWKFSCFSINGSYARLNPFDGSLPTSIYAYLFSPGEGIFWFSPLLLLAPWYLPPFVRRYGAEAAVLGASVLTAFVVYGKLHFWHGQWSFGPRFLMHLVPLLLLPLALWLPTLSRRAWAAVGLLALTGAFLQAIHFATNTSYIYHQENYSNFQPPFGFLFIPEYSQIPAHFRALMAWDYRVDPWLVEVTRSVGLDRTLLLLAVLVWFLVWCLRRLWKALSAES